MQSNWEKAIDFVLTSEVGENYATAGMGAYENNPNDPGGETKWGIAKRYHPNVDIKNLTLEDAKKIYFNEYWNELHCDELASPFDIIAMDCAVNPGVGAAKRLLQMALNINVDGIIGDETIRATFKATPRRAMLMLAMRMRYYVQDILKRPSQEVFDIDWGFRIVALSKLIFSGDGK